MWALLTAAITVGYAVLVLRVAKHVSDLRGHVALEAAIALGIGCGLLGCLTGFAALYIGSGRGLLAAGVVLVPATLLVGRMKDPYGATRMPKESAPRWLNGLLCCAFAGLVGGDLIEFLAAAHLHPLGEWDAWSIWNMHARFLFAAHVPRVPLFSSALTNRDYPVLLPGLVAAGWRATGQAASGVPIAIAFGFTAATVGVVAGTVAWLRTSTLGLLAGIVLLSTRTFVAQGASQYADIPLAFFLATTVALLTAAGARAREAGRPLMGLAGVAAGLAAWTKNEGLLFLCAIGIGYFGSALLLPLDRRLPRERQRDWTPFLAILGSLLLPLLWFKLALAPPSELVAGRRGAAALAQFATWSRYLTVAAAFVRTAGRFPVITLGAIAAALGPGHGWRSRLKQAAPAWMTVAAILVGYFAVYILTPFDLAWHLRTALDRLFMQVWPTIVLLTVVTVAAPEELLPGPNYGREGQRDQRGADAGSLA